MNIPAAAGASAGAAAIAIDGDTLWQDLIALGEITDPARPYTRRSFSALFDQGRQWLTARMHDAGLVTHVDAAGNLIGRLAGRDSTAGVIVIGSHSDSVPSGGRFDGMAGVLAGLAVANAVRTNGIALEHSLEIIDFLAEEPSEFGISCIGSRGMTGALSAAHLAATDRKGRSLAAAITAVGGRPNDIGRAPRADLKAAFELHIEQGPVLEAESIDVGIVTAIVGISRLEVCFTGTAGHAGTTPMTQRRDPLIAAAHLIGWVRDTAELFAARGRGHFVATVGFIEALPGATNVIPKTARLLIDARSEERTLMEEFHAALDAHSQSAAAAANVERSGFTMLSDTMPTRCDARLQRMLGESALAQGLSQRAMASGAGHDMAFIAALAPVAMVFIPCRGGRSHTPEEWASPAALTAGANVLLHALLGIDRASQNGASSVRTDA